VKEDLLEAVRRELERMPEEPFDEFARDKVTPNREPERLPDPPSPRDNVIPIRKPGRLPDPPLVPGIEF